MLAIVLPSPLPAMLAAGLGDAAERLAAGLRDLDRLDLLGDVVRLQLPPRWLPAMRMSWPAALRMVLARLVRPYCEPP